MADEFLSFFAETFAFGGEQFFRFAGDFLAVHLAVIDGLRANDADPEAAAADLRAAVDDHPDAVTSSLAVADYARNQCNVELNPTVPEDPTVTTTSEGGGSEGTTDDTTADGAPVGGL